MLMMKLILRKRKTMMAQPSCNIWILNTRQGMCKTTARKSQKGSCCCAIPQMWNCKRGPGRQIATVEGSQLFPRCNKHKRQRTLFHCAKWVHRFVARRCGTKEHLLANVIHILSDDGEMEDMVEDATDQQTEIDMLQQDIKDGSFGVIGNILAVHWVQFQTILKE